MVNKKPENISFVFFGTSLFSVHMLEALLAKGFIPKLIIATPDKPAGRKLVLTPPLTKSWAEKHNIPVWQPENLKGDVLAEIKARTKENDFDIFIVVSYGVIIPQAVIDIPKKGILNVHPSLLPRLRGATPIESTILYNEKPGTTIMQIDAKMDHGPIIAQAPVEISEWPPYREELYDKLALKSGKLLTDSIMPWIQGDITPQEQSHENATFCRKWHKEDTRINLEADPQENLRKIRAFSGISYAFFTDKDKHGKEIRVKVIKASIQNGNLVLERVIPEGRSEMSYEEYLCNIKA